MIQNIYTNFPLTQSHCVCSKPLATRVGSFTPCTAPAIPYCKVCITFYSSIHWQIRSLTSIGPWWIILGRFGMALKGWWGTSILSLCCPPPQCILVYRYHFSFNMSWCKTSSIVLILLLEGDVLGRAGPLPHCSFQTLVLHGSLCVFWLVGAEMLWWMKGWWGTFKCYCFLLPCDPISLANCTYWYLHMQGYIFVRILGGISEVHLIN